MNWKPGDKAILSSDGRTEPGLEKYEGSVVVLLSEHLDELNGEDVPFWFVDAGKKFYVWEKLLIPIDDYDGHKTTTWDKCVWSPYVPAYSK